MTLQYSPNEYNNTTLTRELDMLSHTVNLSSIKATQQFFPALSLSKQRVISRI